MALSAIKTFEAGEVLYASDLNGMNANILSNALSVISPLTGTLDANSMSLLNVGGLRFYVTGAGSAGEGSVSRTGPRLGMGNGYNRQVLRSTLAINSTIVGNVTGGEDNLMTFAAEPGFFANDGIAVRIQAMFHFAANANTKTLKFYLGASTVTLNTIVTAPNDIYAYADLMIRRFDTNAQRLTGQYVTTTSTNPMPSASWSEVEANALTIKFTGTSGSSASNDIRQLYMATILVS